MVTIVINCRILRACAQRAWEGCGQTGCAFRGSSRIWSAAEHDG